MADAQLINLDKSITTSNLTLNVVQKPSLDLTQKYLYYRSDPGSTNRNIQLKVGAGCLFWYEILVIPSSTAATELYLLGFDTANGAALNNGATPDYRHALSWSVNAKPFMVKENFDNSGVGVPFISGLYCVLSDTHDTLTRSTAYCHYQFAFI